MAFWIKTDRGENIRFVDMNWSAKIYAGGSACDSPEYVFSKVKASGLVSSINFAYKVQGVHQRKSSRVLEIHLTVADKAKKLGTLLEDVFQNPETFQLYNVDVMPEQQYFYDKEIFPLAFLAAELDGDQVARWHLLDNVESFDYVTPKLKCLRLGISIADPVPRMNSRLVLVSISSFDSEDDRERERVVIDGKSEGEILAKAAQAIKELDPDLLITQNGDSFALPFLHSKAMRHGVDFNLNRDRAFDLSPNLKSGTTYFSYGRILFRPATQRLYGRLHLDEENTFIWDQCAMQGLVEVSRLCRMPLQTSMRASIGKCLSGLQFYHATKKRILIPWKPRIAEDFKSARDLLVGDRGGLVLNPTDGIHEGVCEVDFASLYPSIIRDYNISAETVNCSCCSNSKYVVEELGMHICENHKGIVAQSLVLPLDKRFEYKRRRDATDDRKLKRIYNERAASLKWILVCCFGYLSYRNAKFGKIDSHMAVCSIARKTLRDSVQIANHRGFEVLHGIVDSLWVTKPRATLEHYEELCREIESTTGFRLAIEGIYKWIIFLPSKVDSRTQVANRYFGCFAKTNEIKTRGIESRRHDTPPYFKKCQSDMLEEMSKCDNEAQLRECARHSCLRIFCEYAKRLEDREVSGMDLLIRRRLSKDTKEYNSQRQLSVDAASKLERRGMRIRAGQSVSFLITHYDTKGKDRALPEELISERAEYDSKRYVELLADCCATILSPLGVTKEMLLSRGESLLSWM